MLQKYKLIDFFLILLLFIVVKDSNTQIKVFERPIVKDTINKGLYWKSDKRIQIDLNGIWRVSFDDGENFTNLIVPSAYTYKGTSLFKKNFKINDSIIQNYCFLLVAEGINYESEIKINNVFILHHFYGFDSFITPLDENIIKSENEILIKLNSKLNSSTIPLANQINYSENYGGINKDIYIIAVPKIYIFSNHISYKFDSENLIKVFNTIDINSENLSTLKNESKDFIVKTFILKKSSGETIGESNVVKLNIADYQTQNLTNEILVKNPVLWSPESPDLYLIKTEIFSQSRLIDENISETGFVKINIKPENISVNGKAIILNGINYYEDNPRTGSALDYTETEKDLNKIKDYGFNCIRVPGRPAHPYIINICNRIGLFLFQEIPFNEVPDRFLSSRKYVQDAIDYMENIIKRDMNSPCILAWGIGNNFDVTCKSGADYVKTMKEIISKIDTRACYYTTNNIRNDRCIEYADITGINITTHDEEVIKESLGELKSFHQKNRNIFISSYGFCVTNEDRNGFGDKYSIEAQAKLLSEGHKIFANSLFGNFISSFSDWNSELPVNFQQNVNPYLKTDGIFDYYREPKFSAGIIKRINYNQGYQKIPEGSGEKQYSDSNYIFIITGLLIIIIFISLLSKLRYFRENIWKSLITPKNFTMIIKEQLLISSLTNFTLCILIALSLGLYFSSLIYLLRSNIFFDMIISSTFSNDNSKLLFSEISDSPVKLLITTSVISLIIINLTSGFVFLINRFSPRKVYFRIIYTATIWSFIPMLSLLFIGIIFYKFAIENPGFITISLLIFAVSLFYSLIKLIESVRIIYESHFFKAYFLGFLIIFIISGIFYTYFYYIKVTLSIITLILSYKF